MSDGLYVERWGSGRPVVFLHGLGASSRYWRPLAAGASGYAAIAPDLLGFGRSPKPRDRSYDADDHVGHIDPLVPSGAVVVGHSAGAVLAAALARRRSDVPALLLLGLPAYPDEAAARAEIGRLGWLARGTVAGSPAARAVCWAMCQLRPLLLPLAPRLVRDIPREIAADFLRHTWPSYSRTLEQVVVRHRVLPDLIAARTTTMLVHGDQDQAAPVAYARHLAEEATAAGLQVEVRVVAGDHHLAVRQPAAVNNALTELLSRVHVR